MKKIALLLLFFMLTSMAAHKFYVSIYQINFAPEKKMLQITSRIFIDDLNAGLEKYYHKKTHVGENNESPGDIELMKKYLAEHFTIKVNGQKKIINYRSKELEGNVVICYYNIKDIAKVTSLEIYNSALTDLNNEQQNIIQTTVYGKKQSLLLTTDTVNGILKMD